mgnify:CR=1 FL=1|jgi:hypothetical protein
MAMQMQFDFPSVVYGVSMVDITCTGVTRGEGLQRNQQRNWETVLQIFGLLAQPQVIQYPEKHYFSKDDNFMESKIYKLIGTKHQFQIQMIRPETTMWVFAIGTEHSDVFGDDLSILNDVFDLVPVIPNLENTIELVPSVFQTMNTEFRNIQFFFQNKKL